MKRVCENSLFRSQTCLIVLVVELSVAADRRDAGLQGRPAALDVGVVHLEENRVQVLVGDQVVLDHLSVRLDPVFGAFGLEVHVGQRGQEAELGRELVGPDQGLPSLAQPVGPGVVLLLLQRVLHRLEGPESGNQRNSLDFFVPIPCTDTTYNLFNRLVNLV